jgi:hypothetical protein
LFLQESSEADACYFQEIVGQSHNPKLRMNLIQPPQGESAERPIALDVTEHAFHFHFPPSVDRALLVIFKGIFGFCF